MPRIHLYMDTKLQVGDRFRLPEGPSHHLLRVLRARPGLEFTLFNGDGHDYYCRLVANDGGRAQVEAIGTSGRSTASPLEITLLPGLSRGERMDFVIQKAVELGAARIQPVLCAHSVTRLEETKAGRRHGRWKEIIIGACEQAGRTDLPELLPAIPLTEALAGTTGPGLVLDPEAPQRLRDLPPPKGGLAVLHGPEGGLSEGELAAARTAGFTPVSMGPRILRTETAGIAALAALQALWGDM